MRPERKTVEKSMIGKRPKMVTRYVPTYKLTATVSIREDLLKDGDSRKSVDQAEAVKILLESRFKRFIIAGFKIEEVEIL